MEKMFKDAGIEDIIKFPSEAALPTDNMNWITPQSNLWDQLDAVVQRSYRNNDYIFWSWDDVNDTFKISSFDIEKKLDNKYILMESDNAVGSTNTSKALSTKGDFTIWYYDNVQKMNRLGINYTKIFPNIAFSGIIEGELESSGFRQVSFIDMLKERGDDKIEEILAYEDGQPLSYGDLVIKRHWPNNVHKMYSFSDIYRDYKLGVYAKRVEVQIYNNVGPPLGSKVTFIKTSDGFKTGDTSYDKTFSDEYIIIEKVITYNAKSPTVTASNEKMTSANFITKLTLASDNFDPSNNGKAVEHIDNVTKQVTNN